MRVFHESGRLCSFTRRWDHHHNPPCCPSALLLHPSSRPPRAPHLSFLDESWLDGSSSNLTALCSSEKSGRSAFCLQIQLPRPAGQPPIARPSVPVLSSVLGCVAATALRFPSALSREFRSTAPEDTDDAEQKPSRSPSNETQRLHLVRIDSCSQFGSESGSCANSEYCAAYCIQATAVNKILQDSAQPQCSRQFEHRL